MGADPSSEEWLQSQVDQLMGEIQRACQEPFTPWLLDSLWSLPLDEQQLVLLGATGMQTSKTQTRAERSKRLWQAIEDEVRARGGFSNKSRQRPVAPGGESQKAPPKANGSRPVIPNGKPPVRAGPPPARKRSRSRSPSI